MNSPDAAGAVDACARYAGRGWPPYELREADLLSQRQYFAAERLLDDALDGCAPELASNPFQDLALRSGAGFNVNRLKAQAVGARGVADAVGALDAVARAAVMAIVVRAEPVSAVADVLVLRAALDRLAAFYAANPEENARASWVDLMRAARAPLLACLAPTQPARGEAVDDWLARMLAANRGGLRVLHLLYAESLAFAEAQMAAGKTALTLPFEAFAERTLLDLDGR